MISPALAHILRYRKPVASGPTLDPATLAWVAAVITAGGTVSGTQQTRVDTLITALKSASLFSTIDRLWLLNGENAQQRKIDIVSLSSWSTGTSGFTETDNVGIAGDGTGSWIDTNFVPSTAVSPNHSLNSASFGIYCLTNRLTAAGFALMGTTGSGAFGASYILPWYFGNTTYFTNNNDTSHSASVAASVVQGLWLNSRTGISTSEIYHNGSTYLANNTAVGSGLSDFSFGLLCRGGGSRQDFSGDQISAAFIAGGWNSTQVTAFSAALNAYMTSGGINVY